MAKQTIELFLNGDRLEVAVDPWRSLAEVLRQDLGLLGTKQGCNQGQCGACTVLLNGRAVNACLTLAVEAHQRELLTIEGLAQGPGPHPLQEALAQAGATGCGFCAGGLALSAKELLELNPQPSRQEIAQGLAGHQCACGAPLLAVEAVAQAAPLLAPKQEGK